MRCSILIVSFVSVTFSFNQMDSSNCILPPQIFHIVRVFVGKSKLAFIIYSDVVVKFKQLFSYFGAKVDPTSYKLTRPPKHAVMRFARGFGRECSSITSHA